jgi:lysophospholipase L1-like esterase
MHPTLSRLCIAAGLAMLSLASHAAPATPALLPPEIAAAHRVVVIGDSITYAGSYVDFVEAAIRLRDPSWAGEFIDVGLPSETASGLSEPGHAGGRFARPDVHERLDRVLAQLKPDCVIACYGMNDGIYLPFAEDRFTKYQEGTRWLREKVLATHATLIHLTPPVYDPKREGEKHPGYDAVLDRYSDWLLAQRAQGWKVIDLHGPMKAELEARRAKDPAFLFQKDGVHPDRLGHALLARAILSAWHFPPELTEAPLRWAVEPAPEFVRLISQRRKLLSDAWHTATGHKRPGMAQGKPLPEAEHQAAELNDQIRAAMKK